jgi:hypothetical protein
MREIAKHKGRWVAKLVAHLLATCSTLGSNPDIYQKDKLGDISKGVANTL